MDRFDAMNVFVRVVEAGSLSAAARAIPMSLTSVSRHLSALETQFGMQRFCRNNDAALKFGMHKLCFGSR